MKRKKGSGQIAIPALGLVLGMLAFLFAFVAWGRHQLWQMRMAWAADAAALSAARAQAQLLNSLALSNFGVNALVTKMNVPKLKRAVGYIEPSNIPKHWRWQQLMRTEIAAFKTYPPSIGAVVARSNGAHGMPLYKPLPMKPLLAPQPLYLATRIPVFPFVAPVYFREGYYARLWSPGALKAQPPHRTTWVVSGHGVRAASTARLWLDVQTGAVAHNGAFPRVDENLMRGLGIQAFYPQFNARLLP